MDGGYDFSQIGGVVIGGALSFDVYFIVRGPIPYFLASDQVYGGVLLPATNFTPGMRINLICFPPLRIMYSIF